MTGLVSLEISIAPRSSWVLQDTASAPTLYPNLRALSCDFPLDSNVIAFLTRCPLLEELQLGEDVSSTGDPLPEQLPLYIVPHLNLFVGSCDDASKVVPGRPVTAIHLLHGELTETTVDAVAKSSALVSGLQAVMKTFNLPLLRYIAKRLPDIDYIRISVVEAFERPPDTTFLAPIADVLDTFTRMWSFELSGIHWGPSIEPDGHKRWQRDSLFRA